MPGDDQLGAVIYTSLSERSKPCSLEEMCLEVKGLRKRQERVVMLLDRMVRNDIVVAVGNEQYILKEKYTPDLGQRGTCLQSDLACDGPTPTTTNQHRIAVRHESGNPVQSATRALVPVQQRAVQTSSSSVSTCDSPVLKKYTEHFGKILDIFREHSNPIKAKDVAQWTRMGQSKSAVNRYLYILKEHGVLQENGRAEWNIIREVKGDDLVIFGAQLAKIPSKSKQAEPPLRACDCPNAGPTCVHNHITNNMQQNIHHHHHYTQVGDHNQMMGDYTQMMGENNQMMGDHNHMMGDHNHMMGDYNQMDVKPLERDDP